VNTTSHEVRVLTRTEDVAAAAAVFRTAMIGLPLPLPLPLPPLGDVTAVTEPGRTLGAFADGQLIGGADAYTSWLTVPGGARVAHAAVTHVGVLPTHTRRGVLTALLRRQLADIAGRGEVVASLRASEAVIYERFGYGVASWAADYELDRRRGRLRDTVPGSEAGARAAPGPVRLVDAATAVKLLPEVYLAAAWTGSIDRPSYWWHQRQEWAASSTASTGSGPRFVAVHGAEGAEDGYVTYHPVDTASWFGGRNRTVVVDDFAAHSSRAHLGLVRHLAELDLIDTVRLPGRPVDDPLPQLFTDLRAVRVTAVRDETWLRLVDVHRALAARAYATQLSPGSPLVIEVTDELLPANAGRYRIDADGVRRTGEPASISLGVAALAAAYLGGTRFAALATAGRVTERRPGAVALADALFATPRAPFAGTGF
jgi:predicted acetyltransferase